VREKMQGKKTEEVMKKGAVGWRMRERGDLWEEKGGE